MQESSHPVRNISDTALWASYFRAREMQRSDALFRDPFAERLAGARGFEIANTIPEGTKHEWAWVTRTYLFDKFISREIHDGADMVVNLAAGLDARPYRLALPPSLQWIEVDLPEILSYKEEVLAREHPHCRLERLRLDLSDASARTNLFSELNARATNILVLTEGLLIYFSPEEVGLLARDLAAGQNFRGWLLDIASPGLLKMMQKSAGQALSQAGATFKFGPAEGPDFFTPHGWKPKEVQGLLKTAARFKRPPFLLRVLSVMPDSKGPQGNRPWSGVCLLRKR
jgi:methyltransferase (TIGR00027 family)